MVYALLISVFLAAGLHIFIFYLETVAWTSSQARSIFGLSKQEAMNTKAMAANQGVYNLLLAVTAIAGLILYYLDQRYTGLILVISGCGSMVIAALYLFFSSDKKNAAIKQLVFPLLSTTAALILLV